MLGFSSVPVPIQSNGGEDCRSGSCRDDRLGDFAWRLGGGIETITKDCRRIAENPVVHELVTKSGEIVRDKLGGLFERFGDDWQK